MSKKYYNQKKKFPFGKILLAAVVIVGLVMVYNSSLMVKIGLRDNPIPDSLNIDPMDPRIVETFDAELKKNFAEKSMDKLYALLTGRPEQGRIKIHAFDVDRGMGIPGMRFEVVDAITNTAIETVQTDLEGNAFSDLVDYDRAYRVKAVESVSQYPLYAEDVLFKMNSEVVEVNLAHKMPSRIVDYDIDAQGAVNITHAQIEVPLIMQIPDLPNGCEITAMASVLQYYGYEANHLKLADDYLPKRPFYRVNGDLYGPHPDQAFSGNPRDAHGWYAYVPPTLKAANDYLADVGGKHRAVDVSGIKEDGIIANVEKGIPMALWVTRDLQLVRYEYGWYLDDNSGAYYKAAVNLHVMVIYGFDGEDVLVMDPLKGNMRYNREQFFKAYESLGSKAIILEEVNL